MVSMDMSLSSLANWADYRLPEHTMGWYSPLIKLRVLVYWLLGTLSGCPC